MELTLLAGVDRCAVPESDSRNTLRNRALRITPEDENAAWELFCKRPDHTYSFTDCTSFVIMRRLGIKTAAALDDDFASEGFESLPEGR